MGSLDALLKDLGLGSNVRQLIFPLVLLCLCSCGHSRNPFEFCGSSWNQGSMIVDMQHRSVRGADTSIGFSVLDMPMARGFVEPFPFMLPKLPLDQMPGRFHAPGYEFSIGQIERHPDRILITSRETALPMEHVSVRTSIVYSATEGVLAVTFKTKEAPTGTLFSCGTQHLRSDSF